MMAVSGAVYKTSVPRSQACGSWVLSAVQDGSPIG